MNRTALTLIAVLATAVAVVSLRGTPDIAGRPWYASQLDSIEFAEIDTEWQFDDTVPYQPAKPPQEVLRSVHSPESAGIIQPIEPAEPITPIFEPSDDVIPLFSPEVEEKAPEVVRLPPIPESEDSEPPLPSDITRLPPINEGIDPPLIVEDTLPIGVPDVNVSDPRVPKPDAPETGVPEVTVPEVGVVEVRNPEVSAPEVQNPEIAPPLDDPSAGDFVVGDTTPIGEPGIVSPGSEPLVASSPLTGNFEDEPPLPTQENADSSTGAEPAETANQAIDSRDIAFHAGEAIEFRVPAGWRTMETPFGRELRLVVLPPNVEAKAAMPADGVWLSYHVRPFPRTPERDEIHAMIDARMKLASPSGAGDTSLVEETISGLPGASRAFLFDGADPAKSEIGFHMLIGAKHGVIEIHAVSPLDLSRDREVAWGEIIESLVIAEPKKDKAAPTAQAIDAKRILGSWKSMRSSLHLRADGSISIIADPKRGSLLDGSNAEPRPEVVNGQYQAKDDLLMVKWDDGSLLNYRWKKDGIRLLMTDSEGRISQLRRFFN